MDAELVPRVADEVRGFLNALRLLSDPATICWVALLPVETNHSDAIESYFQEHDDSTLLGSVTIGGKEAERFLRENLFDRLLFTAAQKNELWRSLTDYLAIMSDYDSGKVFFGRPWKESALMLSIENPDFRMHGAVALTLTNYVFLIILGDEFRKAPNN